MATKTMTVTTVMIYNNIYKVVSAEDKIMAGIYHGLLKLQSVLQQ